MEEKHNKFLIYVMHNNLVMYFQLDMLVIY